VESKFELFKKDGLNHEVEITRGILEKECAEILKSFFKKRRGSKKTVRSLEFGVRSLQKKTFKRLAPNSEL
jgi:hypothetical protein